MEMIETQNLKFNYKQQRILKDVCLQVPEGAVYGYLGQNGAGKTTTIQLLVGLLRPLQGGILFQGKDFFQNRLLVLQKLGALIGSPSYYSDLTGQENLQCLEYIYKKGNRRISEVLQLAGLENARNKKVSQYSTGMKQRLGIAMAIFHDPDILLLDEPMNGLDPEGIFEIRTLLLRLHGQGKTIFFSSHILSEMDKICTHIGILKDGSLQYQGTLQNLLERVERSVVVKCRDAQKACCFLHTCSITAEIISSTMFSVVVNEEITFNRLLEVLVHSGVIIDSIESNSSSLESVFLKIMSV